MNDVEQLVNLVLDKMTDALGSKVVGHNIRHQVYNETLKEWNKLKSKPQVEPQKQFFQSKSKAR